MLVINYFHYKIQLKFIDSGHYFVYIYDFERNFWRKYNDQHVTEESEETILREAYGLKMI
jgi:ubiquitin C-terminal hydrolase